ncbi:hypothetical protein LEP1GSC116_3299, partial [Leptospira interrogans serovar Icterohaemorrhagiae str. Verdun HP]
MFIICSFGFKAKNFEIVKSKKRAFPEVGFLFSKHIEQELTRLNLRSVQFPNHNRSQTALFEIQKSSDLNSIVFS